MLAEGGFHRIIPPRDPVGDQDLRTHPPGEPNRSGFQQFDSFPRFHTIGKIQRKSNRDGLLWSALFNCSIAVTNRVWSAVLP